MSAFGTKLRKREDGTTAFYCPGCRMAHAISIDSGIAGRDWTFNGNPDCPTFSPSVLWQTHTHEPPVTPENIDEWRKNPWPQTRVAKVCHSFVTDGRIQFLTDCTHALAGQTVDLPDFPA